MPKPRLTPDFARVTGADKRSPGRFKDRANPKVAPLGEPPEQLSEPIRAAWLDLADDLPWLARSDRAMLELTARLVVMAEEPGAPIGVLGQLRLCLSSLAATPVDRSKVPHVDDGDDDPADEFFQ